MPWFILDIDQDIRQRLKQLFYIDKGISSLKYSDQQLLDSLAVDSL